MEHAPTPQSMCISEHASAELAVSSAQRMETSVAPFAWIVDCLQASSEEQEIEQTVSGMQWISAPLHSSPSHEIEHISLEEVSSHCMAESLLICDDDKYSTDKNRTSDMLRISVKFRKNSFKTFTRNVV